MQQAYPNGHFYAETPTSFCWKYSVQPSSLSGTYQFKICYKEGKHVDVFALDKLSLCEGEKGLPHVYNTDKQHLLYLSSSIRRVECFAQNNRNYSLDFRMVLLL